MATERQPQTRRRARVKSESDSAKPVTLALQGGGAHGAFTWGVLDYLLEDGRLAVEAISATSAGAMNAVVMAHGVSRGGREGARKKLGEFWHLVSERSRLYSPVQTWPWERWLQNNGMHGDLSMSFLTFQAVTRTLSPYQFNPLNLNPLRDVLNEVVDFSHLCQCPIATRIYLSATNVKSGKIKVFQNNELSADAVLASACLPDLFQAVEIKGQHYWDGGFMGNPAIFPLIYRQGSRDVVIVHINPIEREKVPTTAPEIYDRMNEVSFNSTLMAEMRAIAFVTRLLEHNRVDPTHYSRMHIHSIRDDKTFMHLGVASKLDANWTFLTELRDKGRAVAATWLDTNHGSIGERSSVDLSKVFL